MAEDDFEQLDCPHDPPFKGPDWLFSDPEIAPLALAVRRFMMAMNGYAAAMMLHLGLTMPQIKVLGVIRMAERISGRQLAGALGVTPAAVVAMCDRLVEQGYVKRVADTVDRRVTWFQVGERVPAEVERFLSTVKPRLDPIIRSIPPRERDSLAAILTEGAVAIEQIRDELNPYDEAGARSQGSEHS
ncbi:MAG: MarR family transcriptional regulator [Chloroflexota bacterium]|nr:MarR family transcriptional regulator [Chloroflexota bacterium]